MNVPSFRWIAVKLLVFTIVTIVVTTYLASIIGNFRLFAQPYEITAELTDASGLLRGDVVKAAGVTVGRVEEIGIRDGIAVVTMSIDEGTELPDGLEARVRFRNLVGQRMITLDAPPPATGRTQAGDVIPIERTEPAFDLSALFNGLRPLIRSTDPEDINTVTRALTRALSGRAEEVEGFLANVGDISTSLASKDRELAVMLDALNEVTSDLNGRDAQLQATLADLDEFLGDLHASRHELSAALVTLDDAATRLGRVVARNDADIEAEIDDLAVLLDAVDDKRADLRGALRALPEMLVAVERVNSYGQWANIHLVHVCKDDTGECGRRWMP
ncbi:MAG TPA: MCE family protein [Actinomycetota bacterium]|nr:MCE family protein [Actinomycetota bacterium]